MHSNYIDNEFKSICSNYKEDIEQFSLKTGVIDFRISWKNKVCLDILHDFYEELISHNMVSNIETSIIENILL